MGKKYRAIDVVGNYIGMLLLIKIGILVLLSTCSIGRNVPTENYDETNSTIFDEEPLENNCNCEWRYYKHYETKGCQVVQVDSCGCPKKFLCPLSSTTSEEQKVCIYQNEEYKVGTRLNITDKCQSCRCLATEDQAQIVCRNKECPQLEYVGDGNCHLVYEKDHCCPSKYECVLNTNENEATGEDSFCVHDGVTYPIGAKIYPPDDPCLICHCTENWRGISNTSCYQHNCLFEKNKLLLLKGCVPVYHENRCCPIEFYCPDDIQNHDNSLEAFKVENTDVEGDKCVFGSNSFEIGKEIPMQNPCIKCTCLVPPDFTCVHQSCPPSPSSEDCQAYYSFTSCCPSYNCSLNDVSETGTSNMSETDTSDMSETDASLASQSDVSEIDTSDMSETDESDFSKDACPTPQCADATCVIKIPEGHLCPTCVCNETTSHERNIFETTEEVRMEGPEEIDRPTSLEELDGENENSEAEILIPSNNSKVTGEKEFAKDYAYDEREHSEVEGEPYIYEKETENDSTELFSNKSISFNESEDVESESEDHRQKRSVLGQHTSLQQGGIASNQIAQSSQQQFFEEEEMESNREISEDNDEGFDELKFSSSNRKSLESRDNSEESSEIFILRDCPTPMCANSSCKIEIPTGHRCPTCICKYSGYGSIDG